MSIRNLPALGATLVLVAGLAACGSSSHAATTPVTVYDVSADPGKNLPTTDAKHLAQEQLLAYQNDFASLLTTATASAASLPAVTGLLHAHVHDLTSYIDADVAGNDTEARQILVHAVATMHVIAKTVSDAIAAQHLRTVAP